MSPGPSTLLVLFLTSAILPSCSWSEPGNPVRWVVRSLTGGREPVNVIRELGHALLAMPGVKDPEHNKVDPKAIQEPRSVNEDFPCDVTTPWARPQDPPPSSVHRLRPADVRVVAAMGDSLTAGNGAYASNVFQVVAENRGAVWSIGGAGSWRTVLTIPNILREFSGKPLVGASRADSLSHEMDAQFNVADSLAVSGDMPGMARVLVRRIKADPRVDFDKDWKVVTLHIGGNDMCFLSCRDEDDGLSVWERHEKSLREALDHLRDNLPRTFINLVLTPDVADIIRRRGVSLTCRIVNYLQCPCLLSPSARLPLPVFEHANKRMQQAAQNLVLSGRYDDEDNFTVVAQPFPLDFALPLINENLSDLSYTSQDCFHFSQKGYAWAANALWNNMLEPVGNKSFGSFEKPFSRFECPSEAHPYLATARNRPPATTTNSLKPPAH